MTHDFVYIFYDLLQDGENVFFLSRCTKLGTWTANTKLVHIRESNITDLTVSLIR